MGHYVLLFSISGMGSFVCPGAQTLPQCLIYQDLYLPSPESLGERQSALAKADSNRRPVGPQLNTPTTRPR